MITKSSKVLLLALILILSYDFMGVQATTIPSYVPNPNCDTTNTTGPCTTACNNGYFLATNGYCYKSNPYCATYNTSTGLCLTCTSPLYFTGGYCINISSTCATGTPGTCTTCASNYAILSGFCVVANTLGPFCNQFSGSSCTNCTDQYYVFMGGCTPSDPSCLTYNMTTGYCTSCYSGYSVQNGACVS
jgi:hypothetical protein